MQTALTRRHALLLASAAGLSHALILPARAQAARPVIELFTSQGCSSCPPADALVMRMAQENRALVLSVPVDYWDYLGWKDTLARPAFSARQRAYASARSDGQVYTPQAVVNGVVHAVGSDEAALVRAEAKARTRKGAMSVPVTAREKDGSLVVDAGAATPGGIGKATLWLVPVHRRRNVEIKRGENSGKFVTYANVATDYIPIGEWNGTPVSITLPLTMTRPGGCDGYAILLQGVVDGRPGLILGAAASEGV